MQLRFVCGAFILRQGLFRLITFGGKENVTIRLREDQCVYDTQKPVHSTIDIKQIKSINS